MSSWLKRSFGYGLGAAVGDAIFGEGRPRRGEGAPVRSMTEAEIRADEKRFDEEARALDEAEGKVGKR